MTKNNQWIGDTISPLEILANSWDISPKILSLAQPISKYIGTITQSSAVLAHKHIMGDKTREGVVVAAVCHEPVSDDFP